MRDWVWKLPLIKRVLLFTTASVDCVRMRFTLKLHSMRNRVCGSEIALSDAKFYPGYG